MTGNARIRARATHHDLLSAIPDKMREIEKRKRERQKGRKGKYNGDAIREFTKTKKKNDPSVIVFHLQKLCWS